MMKSVVSKHWTGVF